MCGIFGFAGNVPNKVNLMRWLICLNSVRGTHSSGVAVKINNNVNSIFKRATHPFKFSRKIPRYLNSIGQFQSIIGHTRWATHGAINKQNAHPFKIGNIIGTHNGIVSNLDELKEYLECNSYEVDSQYLIHSLAKKGHLGIAYGSLNVAYFVEGDDYLLHLIRHNNPLSIAYVNNKTGLVYASDNEHLEKSLQANRIAGQIEIIKHNCAISFYTDSQGKINLVESVVPFDVIRKEVPKLGFVGNCEFDPFYQLDMRGIVLDD